jgi:hypothetical protein
MSSDLLQQAMIDAAALKEAAIKSAENALIEKYSQEFNQTVQRLLEQEEAAATPPADAAAAPPPDMSAGATPPADATTTPDLSAGGADPMAGGDSVTGAQQDAAFAKVPGAFSGDDDQLITINFDQIKATLNEMMGVGESEMLGNKDVGADALAAGNNPNPDVVVRIKGSKNDVVEEWEQEEHELEEDGLGGSDQQEFEGLELEEIELQEVDVAAAGADDMKHSADLKQQAAAAEQRANTAKLKASEEQEKAEAAAQKTTPIPSADAIAEDIELTEEELMELAESLKVDLNIDNMSDGWMGSTVTQKREQRVTELAAARDEMAAEQREKEVKKMKDLMQENTQIKSLNNEALSTVAMLKEQVEKLNVLNAKLLYTNKALGNISLNERQKQNIVESISKADSVLAAKTIYETVQNAVENNAKEQEAPQSLRETLNRAATPFVVKKSAGNSISDLMAERMKALAGIKK